MGRPETGLSIGDFEFSSWCAIEFCLRDDVQGAFEGNRLEFAAKEFLMKPPIQFFRGLDVLQMSAR